MADRYWVGGTGTWNTTSTTNWSASSGGASGASVPTVSDNVFFDQAGTYTVIMTGALACLDITVSAGTVTFATGTSPTLNVRGSMSLLAGTVWSATGNVTFSSTTTGRTVTTNGVSISATRIIFSGVGGEWTLGSALTTGALALDVANGTFNSGNYSITVSGQFYSNYSTTRTINLGSSIVSLAGTSVTVNLLNITGLTFNAGTSQINLTASTGAVATAGTVASPITFYNVAFTSTTAGTRPITGVNTFNNLSVTGPASAGVTTVTFDSKQIINGTLSTTGTAGNRRVFFDSATYGISVDLAVNATPSLTDADFRGIYVTGTSAPISGTRIGNRGECRGITFDTPKTVYWNLSAGGNWSANAWALSSGGAVSTDNFPLPQDTAVVGNTGLNTSATITLDAAIAYVGNIDMSGRTNAMTLSNGVSLYTVYGNWTNGSGVTLTTPAGLVFSGGGTQTITSAGKTFSSAITVNTYGGTVQLADALNIGSNSFTVTNGTYDTKGYNHSSFNISSNNSNVRTIKLGASTVTLGSTAPISVGTSTNLTFDAGTSTINLTGTTPAFAGNGLTFYNVSFTSATVSASNRSVTGANTFNNLTFTAPSIVGVSLFNIAANQTINGTLTCAGASAVRRIFVRSDAIGTQRDLTVGTLVADDCDFRDIDILGTAAGTAPTRAGDCGGNAGITFPAAKTVYWVQSNSADWSRFDAWSDTAGGTADISFFPLAQDTAVVGNTYPLTGNLITINAAWNIGTFDASGRTSAMTLTTSTNSPVVYGDWKFGTGVTSTSTTGTIIFFKNGTQTITSNGVQFGCNVTVNHPSGTVQLADALSLGATRTLTLTTGTFDAVTYNVTVGLFAGGALSNTVRMGSGTWTLSGTGTVWGLSGFTTVVSGSSTIVLSDTSTTARTFSGQTAYYNKLTIGGTTGTSTLTITGTNTFGELASTKTVAHTITFPSSATTTIGKWAVTGTVGNVVTVNSNTAGTAFTLSIAGPANSGIDYLSVRDCTVDATSPGEFYVGANSTNVSGNTRVIFTATPTPRTLYWVGGTGNWSSTTRWSTSSGGGSGAAIPTSLDAVVFDSASNATAYTATIDAGVTLARCASFTMAGPASGNVTFAGTVGIAFHGNVSFAATGITRTYTGAMQWAGNSSYIFTTNGLALSNTSNYTVIGIGSTWDLGSALNVGTASSTFTVTYGTFSTSASNYALTTTFFSITGNGVRTVSLNGSTITCAQSSGAFNATTTTNLTFNASTSQINFSNIGPGIVTTGLTFNNVSFTNANATGITITGANTFNTLSFAGRTTVGITPVTFSANQTITTLTLNAGTAAAYRTFLASDTIGTQRTLTVTTLTAGAADYDFRDIAITGGAAPISGTRFGDCKGNSGITFDAGKTVYWRNALSANWGATGAGVWSATLGGTADATQFPLSQDTAVFDTYPAIGNTATVNANYNIGTIDMSARTANTMTLATGSTTPAIYGNWINGTGTTLTGTGLITFAGRGAQTITSAGKTFPMIFAITTPGGSVTLQDALSIGTSVGTAGTVRLTAGTFDLAGYNLTLPNTGSAGIQATGTNTRTFAVGAGAVTVVGSGTVFDAGTAINLTVTGTGTISLTSASAKTFAGGGISYSGITLDQGGAGALTITGNNTFKAVTNTYSATGATSIALGATTQTLTNPWTATGAAGNVLTVSGTSAASPATLIFSGSGTAANVDYLTINNVRAYDLTNEWYAGANSTNGGSLGWYFVSAGGTVYAVTITETGTGTDAVTAQVTLLGTISETGTGTDSVFGGLAFAGSVSESATGTDAFASNFAYLVAILESALGSDAVNSALSAAVNISEAVSGTDAVFTNISANSAVSESATASDAILGLAAFLAQVSETANASDIVFTVREYLASVLESATGTDASSARAIFGTQIAEGVTAQDIINAHAVFAAQLSESATGTDLVSALRVLTAVIAESAAGSEVVSALMAFNTVISEGGTIADALSAAGSTYNPAIAEVATQTDQPFAAATFPVSTTDTATGTDAVAPRYIANPAVSESATITDVTSALAAFAARTAESASITDQATPPGSVYNPVVLAVATALDSVDAPGSIYNPVVLASATATDSLIGGFLWNLIDDAQNPNWGGINNAQTAGWQTVDSGQTNNWQNVNNAQNPGWTIVDDNQTPNWQNNNTLN